MEKEIREYANQMLTQVNGVIEVLNEPAHDILFQNIAIATRKVYDSFINVGFTPEQAITLCVSSINNLKSSSMR